MMTTKIYISLNFLKRKYYYTYNIYNMAARRRSQIRVLSLFLSMVVGSSKKNHLIARHICIHLKQNPIRCPLYYNIIIIYTSPCRTFRNQNKIVRLGLIFFIHLKKNTYSCVDTVDTYRL